MLQHEVVTQTKVKFRRQKIKKHGAFFPKKKKKV